MREARAGSRTAVIMEEIRTRISSRVLSAGDRLPSVRGFAATMGVSPSTVVEAYDRLAAEGLIKARVGSGFYVTRASAPLALAPRGSSIDRAIDPFWVSRLSLDADPAAVKPGCGWLPDDWMPNGAIQKAMRALAKDTSGVLTEYGPTRGLRLLRLLLARRFAGEELHVDPDQILLTGSGTQAIDLLCRLLLRPGDTVVVDDPCYFNFRATLRAHQAHVVGVAMTPAGPDVEAFRQAVERYQPRLYVTNSAIHNPTGATLSPQIAHQVLTEASAHDVTVIEDDIFTDFEPEPSPRLAVLDGLSRVIRIGSFSKPLSASVRCGYIAAKPELIEGLIDLQVASSFSAVSPMAAQLVHDVLSDGGYRKHVQGLHRRLAHARQSVAAQLNALGMAIWTTPRGGFYLWASLPDGQDAAAVARIALREGVVLAPGNVFSPSATATSFMRFNVTQMGGMRSLDVIANAMAVEGLEKPDEVRIRR